MHFSKIAVFFLLLAAAHGLAAPEPQSDLRAIDDIRIRDPFIYADASTGTYYMYAAMNYTKADGQTARGVGAYRSRDLKHWSAPVTVLKPPAGFWGGQEVWAPEMHRIGDFHYLFVSFDGREGGRGTQVFRADSPAGPFKLFSEHANTPPEQRALDGTPWIDDAGRWWMVYCHEWVQIGDGGMLAIQMEPGFTGRIGEPITLFHASDAPWPKPFRGEAGKYITDGPFLYRAGDGRLMMVWSSFTGDEGRTYGVGLAVSDSGRVEGPWRHQPMPLLEGGGHAMRFKTFAGELLTVLHQPNRGKKERAHLFTTTHQGGCYTLTPHELP